MKNAEQIEREIERLKEMLVELGKKDKYQPPKGAQTGGSVEVSGVKIMPCDEFGNDRSAPVAEGEWEASKQYRAIIGRPWSILDRDIPRGEPVLKKTGPKDEKKVQLYRPEESHEWVEGWEERDVRFGPWRPVEGESNGA